MGPVVYWFYRHSRMARIFIQRMAALKTNKAGVTLDVAYDGDEVGWARTEAEYKKILEICLKNGARLVIIHIPYHAPWEARHFYPGKRLKQWCADNKVLFLDIQEVMKNQPNPERFHWKWDSHCTPAGYELIADELTKILKPVISESAR